MDPAACRTQSFSMINLEVILKSQALSKGCILNLLVRVKFLVAMIKIFVFA